MKEDVRSNRALQRSLNPDTLELLRSKGVDLSKVRSVINVFYSNDRRSYAALSGRMSRDGFRVSECSIIESTKDSFAFCVELSVDLPPTLEAINEMTDACVGVSAILGAEYDGWYTEVR